MSRNRLSLELISVGSKGGGAYDCLQPFIHTYLNIVKYLERNLKIMKNYAENNINKMGKEATLGFINGLSGAILERQIEAAAYLRKNGIDSTLILKILELRLMIQEQARMIDLNLEVSASVSSIFSELERIEELSLSKEGEVKRVESVVINRYFRG